MCYNTLSPIPLYFRFASGIYPALHIQEEIFHSKIGAEWLVSH